MPVITFMEYTPDRSRAEHELQRIATRLSQPGVIERDPHAEGYVQKPLDWAPTPQSFCRLFDDETIAKHLAALTNRSKATAAGRSPGIPSARPSRRRGADVSP